MRLPGDGEVLGGGEFAPGGNLGGQVVLGEFLLAHVGELGGTETGLGVQGVQPISLNHAFPVVVESNPVFLNGSIVLAVLLDVGVELSIPVPGAGSDDEGQETQEDSSLHLCRCV